MGIRVFLQNDINTFFFIYLFFFLVEKTIFRLLKKNEDTVVFRAKFMWLK